MKKSSESPCGLLNLQAKIYKTVTSLLLYMYYRNEKYITRERQVVYSKICPDETGF